MFLIQNAVDKRNPKFLFKYKILFYIVILDSYILALRVQLVAYRILILRIRFSLNYFLTQHNNGNTNYNIRLLRKRQIYGTSG